jgi:hypothetical protein
MENKRYVDKILSVFDLIHCQALGLPEEVSIRVMFVYDRKENIKDFKLLGNTISRESADRINSWLKKNVHNYEMICHSTSNEIDLSFLIGACRGTDEFQEALALDT